MAKLTKKAKALAAAVDREKLHGVDEALGLIKTHATAKFDESVEIEVRFDLLGLHEPGNGDHLQLRVPARGRTGGPDEGVLVQHRADVGLLAGARSWLRCS